MFKLLENGQFASLVGTNETHSITTSPIYLAWLAEGNTPLPADIPPAEIPVITMRQARLALLDAGLLATVDGYISGQLDDAIKIYWDYSTEVHRDNPLVNQILTALGKSSADIDNLFLLGETL